MKRTKQLVANCGPVLDIRSYHLCGNKKTKLDSWPWPSKAVRIRNLRVFPCVAIIFLKKVRRHNDIYGKNKTRQLAAGGGLLLNSLSNPLVMITLIIKVGK